MGPTLPFGGFLDQLRAQGYSVGLHEHMALARLLTRWEGTDPEEIGTAIAALVGKSDAEVTAIRQLFGEAYIPPPPPLPPPPPPPAVAWWRRPVVALATAGALLIAALLAGYYAPGSTSTPPQASPADQLPPQASPADQLPPPPPPVAPGAPVEAPAPTPPELPVPPAAVASGALVQTGAALFLCALALFWSRKRQAVSRKWIREMWRASLGAVPGPYRYEVHLPPGAMGVARAAVEDAANILGRIYGADERSRELDPAQSLRQTLRKGLLPTLVFRRVRTARPIVAMCDVGVDMRPWQPKVEALLTALRRQGVSLERWYFDGDPRRLADRPHGTPKSIDQVIGTRVDQPVLIVSAGGGLAALGSDDTWMKTLGRLHRRAWLTPVADTRLWPAPLTKAPLHSWPMTREGLTSAARALAGQSPAETVRVRVLAEQRATWDDIERVKRLASLAPGTTPELLEHLRQRFAPDVPDSAVVHVTFAAGAAGLREIRLDEEEIRRLTAAVRAETPSLEAAVRSRILDLLAASEPAQGSAAHLRWQLATALQAVSLAAVREGDAGAATATLRDLRDGPLWEEVDHAARLVPDAEARMGRSANDAPTRPPVLRAGASARGLEARPHSAPGWREFALATTAALAGVLIAWWAGLFPTTTLARVENAYELTSSEATASGNTVGAITLELRRIDPDSPANVDLYRDGTLLRQGVVLGELAEVEVVDGGGHTYQAQALGGGGRLALSRPLWVPDSNRVVVVIDAHPWARVTIEAVDDGTAPASAAIADEPTPLRVALRPGRFRVGLENGGVTAPLEQIITVAPNDPNQRFSFVMPGFDPTAAAERGAGGATAQ